MVGFCDVEVFGVPPPPKSQLQLVGEPVELSVKVTELPAQTVVALAVKSATGGREFTPVILILSTYSILPYHERFSREIIIFG